MWGWFTIAAIGLLLVVAGLFYLGYQGQELVNSGIEGLEISPDPGQGHQDGDLTYTEQVPVGGVHNPTWLNCGIYDAPIRTENVIHSMEHGAVWITYRPDLDSADVSQLRGFVGDEGYLLLSPYPNLASNIVLTAWGVQLEIDSVDDERIEQFISVYRNGPQTPEKGASCSGGVGTPIG
jgi:hypothetical protein